MRDNTKIVFRGRNIDCKNNIPIIFIHGAMGDGSAWLMLSHKLAKALPNRRSYLLDLPGHGKNIGGECASVPDFAKAVLRFIETKNFEKAILVGHSMGSAVAQLVARDAPKKTDRLVLLASGLKLKGACKISQALDKNYEESISAMPELMFSPNAAQKLVLVCMNRIKSIAPDLIKKDFEACAAFDSEKWADAIQAPAIVCCGSADLLTTPEQNRMLADKLRCGYFEIPSAGHMIHLEAADRLAEIIAEFLSR